MEKYSIYEGKEPYIFVSYAHRDSKVVLPLIRGLMERGYRVWFDEGVEAGTEWPSIIARHLKNSACVILFLSKNAVESHNCRQELTMSINRKKNPLIVMLEDIDWAEYDESEEYGGVEMQISTLHQLYYKRHPDNGSFLKSLTLYKALHSARESRKSDIVFSPEECYRVGRAYLEGLAGIEPNQIQAEQWLRKAADNGHIGAMKEMGWIYGYARDQLKEAIAWYRKAAEQGDAEAMYLLGGFLEMGDDGQWMESEEWILRSAELGYPPAQVDMGERMAFWYSNSTAGVEWFRKAAEQGYPGGMVHLGECYETGSGVPEDAVKALTWYRKAAEQGDSLAIEHLKVLGEMP